MKRMIAAVALAGTLFVSNAYADVTELEVVVVDEVTIRSNIVDYDTGNIVYFTVTCEVTCTYTSSRFFDSEECTIGYCRTY